MLREIILSTTIVAIALGLLGISQLSSVSAQQATGTVVKLTDKRNGAVYQYVVNSTKELGEVVKNVYQAGNPGGPGTQSLGNDPTVAAINNYVADAPKLLSEKMNSSGIGAASLSDSVPDVASWKSFKNWAKSQVSDVVSTVGPIVVETALEAVLP